MRHVVMFIAALILLAFAGVVVWYNRTALTMWHLAFAAGCILLAFALAIPADFKDACASVAPYIPLIRGKGAGAGQ